MIRSSNYSNSAFLRFFKGFVQGSYPLFAAAVAAVIWANVSHENYYHFWHSEVSVVLGPFEIAKSLAHWIDDALMTVFFFTVGLEIKREFLVGGLSTPKQALLPVSAAIGGMLVPALIYAGINAGTPEVRGWGIPMATDIAFSLAVLGLLGSRIPFGIKLFLSAFAIADDLGAVLVIALFYTSAIQWSALLVGGGFLVLLFLANRLWIHNRLVYLVLGLGLWLCIMSSGVHATVAGVLAAMFIPARGKCNTDTFVERVKHLIDRFECSADSCGHSILLNRDHLDTVQAIDLACRRVETPLQQLEHQLHPWISYAILPLFALANTGIFFQGLDWQRALVHPVALGIFIGLFIGKPLGIGLFTFLTIRIFKIQLTGRRYHQTSDRRVLPLAASVSPCPYL